MQYWICVLDLFLLFFLYRMAIIGWSILLCILLVGLYVEGIAVGLLSGLSLTLLTFSGSLFPTAPPYAFMLLQIAWIILMAALEAAGFFHFLETKYKYTLPLPWPLSSITCLFLLFITGNLSYIYAAIDKQRYHFSKQLFLIGGIVAYILSPLSLPGILLFLVKNTHTLSTASLLYSLLPIAIFHAYHVWPNKQHKTYHNDPIKPPQAATGQRTYAYVFLLLLLFFMGSLFLLAKPTANGFTTCSPIGKVFALNITFLYALIMLSTAAMVLLCFNIKPAQMLLTHRFKLGIKQFFHFLGLVWLLDTLINNDQEIVYTIGKHFLLGIQKDTLHVYSWHVVSLFIAWLYVLLLDIEIIIWLFIPLLAPLFKEIFADGLFFGPWILLMLAWCGSYLTKYWIACFVKTYTQKRE